MSYFQYIEERDGLSWFYVTKNKVHYIAWLFQQGDISCERIKTNKYSTALTIGLFNSRDWKFTPNEKYHLILDGNKIAMYYNYDDYVPSWYRPRVGDISDTTWNVLGVKQSKLLSVRVEYHIGTHEQKIVTDYNELLQIQRELEEKRHPRKYEYDSDDDLNEYYEELSRMEYEKRNNMNSTQLEACERGEKVRDSV